MATVPGVFLGHKSSKEVWHNVVMVNQSLSHFGWQNLKDKHYFRSREDVPNYLRAWAGFPAAWVAPGLRCVYTAWGHVCRGSMAGWGSGHLGMWGLATNPLSPHPHTTSSPGKSGSWTKGEGNLQGPYGAYKDWDWGKRSPPLVPAALLAKWQGAEPLAFVDLLFLPLASPNHLLLVSWGFPICTQLRPELAWGLTPAGSDHGLQREPSSLLLACCTFRAQKPSFLRSFCLTLITLSSLASVFFCLSVSVPLRKSAPLS